MLKRRPPLTTLATRLTWTTVSSRFNFEASILAILLLAALKFEAGLSSPFGQRRHSSMIGVAATIKDHLADAFFFCALSDQLAYFTGQRDLAVVGNGCQRLNGCLFLALLCLGQDGFDLRRRFAALALRALLLRLPFCGGFRSLLGLRALASGGRQGLSSHFDRLLCRLRYSLRFLTCRLRRLYLKIAQGLIQ